MEPPSVLSEGGLIFLWSWQPVYQRAVGGWIRTEDNNALPAYSEEFSHQTVNHLQYSMGAMTSVVSLAINRVSNKEGVVQHPHVMILI